MALEIETKISVEPLHRSKMGYEFNIYSDFWKLDGSLTLNWQLLDELYLDNSFKEGLRKTLAVYASETSAKYTHNIFTGIKSLLVTTNSRSLTLASVQNYLGTLDKQNEYKLGAIKAFILDWHERRFIGLDPEVPQFLEELVLKGNVKGKSVAKGCPHTGAYSQEEQNSILNWAANAFHNDDLNTEQYTWLIANIYLGSRPVQIRSLTRADVTTIQSEEVISYGLKLVLGKQRNAGFREVFDDLDIDEDLALLLINQAQESINYIEGHFGKDVPKALIPLTPIFISREAIRTFHTLQECYESLKTTPDYIFMRSDTAIELMNKISAKCDVRTTRLQGEYLTLRARRFRYTLGTNASMRGCSVHVIAKMLGHKDTQSAKIYVENTSEAVAAIDEAMAPVLAPLAQQFAGTLIKSERDAIRANDPRSRIKARDGKGLGNCGEFGFCASGGRQCYTCYKFEPWINAEHQSVLNCLLSEREDLRRRGASEYVIQSTDHVVMAIQQVILLCEKAKLSLSQESRDN